MWKATAKLSLTYGVRWDYNPPPTEAHGNVPFAGIGLDNPSTIAFAPRGTPLWKTVMTNFAPRLGVAYQFFGGKGWGTVLRGGVGSFYDLGTNQGASAFNNAFPYSRNFTLVNEPFPPDPARVAPPALSTDPPYSGVINLFDPNLKTPRTYQWNVSIEQVMGTIQAVSISYVVAKGRDLLRTENFFGPNANFVGPSGTAVARVGRSTATSDYNALQLQYRRRLSRGLEAVASYSWAKSLDDASNDSLQHVPGQKIDPVLDRGPSDFDVRHSLIAAVTYNIPGPGIHRMLVLSCATGQLTQFLELGQRRRSTSPIPLTLVRDMEPTLFGQT